MRRTIGVTATILALVMMYASVLIAAENDKHVRVNQLIAKIERGESVVGLIIGNRTVDTGLMLQDSGLDFIVIGMEHFVYDFNSMQDIILGLYHRPFSNEFIEAVSNASESQGRSAILPPSPPIPLVKIARKGREQIEFDVRHVLKMGALGVFIPYTESRADIEAAVQAATGPESEYIRGISGEDFRERDGPWPLLPKGEFIVGAMIESEKGGENIEEIINTPGLGALWLAHPPSDEVTQKALKMCQERGIPVMGDDVDPARFSTRRNEGYQMFSLGWDTDMFFKGLSESMKTADEELGK